MMLSLEMKATSRKGASILHFRDTVPGSAGRLLEVHLQSKNEFFAVPMREKFAFGPINFQAWNFESDCLIGFGSNEQVLEVAVGSLHLLLISRHKPMTRLKIRTNLRIFHLEEKASAARVGVILLGHSVPVNTRQFLPARVRLHEGTRTPVGQFGVPWAASAF
jgi:hypothetical protein